MADNIVDILEDFINSIDFSQSVINYVFEGAYTRIEVSETWHLRKSMSVDIDGTDYKVHTVENKYILIEGEVLNPSVVTIPAPFYLHGTPQQANVELGQLRNSLKTPLAYLVEILSERKINFPEDSLTGREGDIVIFFLDNCQRAWITDKHYSNVIDRMKSLTDYIEEKLIAYSKFAFEETATFQYVNHANFGEYVTNKGHVNSIFDETFSGIEMRFTLPIKKNLGCN